MDKGKIISEMTVRQKAQLLTGMDFWQTKSFSELGIESIFLTDGPHGIRKQSAETDHLGLNASLPATCFPTASAMANSWNEQLGEEIGRALGEEAASLNVNVLLGPGTCMKRNPLCGRNFEYFSEDPYLAGKMAASYIRGIQANGTSACVKHFACNNQEERRMVSDSVVDERTLREIYLTAFEIAVKEGKTKALMTSYNKINGTYADENTHLIGDILRGEWGYQGAIISDWAACNNKVNSIKAGSDLEMPACKYSADDIVQAVNDGTLDISYVNKCVMRVLTLIEQTSESKKLKPYDKQEHNELAKKCADESIVLLKNDGVLPLKKYTKVALVGDFVETPRYQGAGSSLVNPTTLGTVLLYKDNYLFETVGYEKGFDRYGKSDKTLMDSAVNLAKKADVVVMFMGLDELSEAEGLDREHIKINSNQIDLYNMIKETGKKIVVVLMCGSAVDLTWSNSADAIVYACLSGQAGAASIMDVLAGKVNPSGKLAETFPINYYDCPTAHYFPGKEMTVEYREGPFIGYRYYDTADVKVAYPFGFGLSYTTFEYCDLKVDGFGATFTIKNKGERDGSEIAQLYVGMKDSKIFRPTKELKGFKKVFIKSGESARVHIPFNEKTFRYFNIKTNKWEVEGGAYQIYIASSVDNIRFRSEVHVEGSTAVVPYDKQLMPSYYSGQIENVSDKEFAILLGRQIPKSGYNFYKKNRMIIDENCTVGDLRYSKRWVGRLFSWSVRFSIGFCKKFGMRIKANALVVCMLNQPVRGLAKFGGKSRRKIEGLLLMCNGHFFKGAAMYVTKEKAKKQN